MDKISLYEYVASNSPEESRAICNKYGYNIPAGSDPMGIAHCLNELVISDGAQPLHDIISIHPDRELLSESFSFVSSTAVKATDQSSASTTSTNKCNCDKTDNAGMMNGLHLQQGNLFVIGGILLAAIAIIATSNK